MKRQRGGAKRGERVGGAGETEGDTEKGGGRKGERKEV